MIAGFILIFAVPMVVAALLISPDGLHYLIHGVPLYVVLGLLLRVMGVADFPDRVRLAKIGGKPIGRYSGANGTNPSAKVAPNCHLAVTLCVNSLRAAASKINLTLTCEGQSSSLNHSS
jgi:hypothetical protein